jgi:hypothetical protein
MFSIFVSIVHAFSCIPTASLDEHNFQTIKLYLLCSSIGERTVLLRVEKKIKLIVEHTCAQRQAPPRTRQT